MPIAPEHRWLYPIDWRELSNLIRFRRAKGRCEHCRRPHGRNVFHLGDGAWWDEDTTTWRDGQGRGLRYLPTPDELPGVQPGFAGIDPPALLRITRVVLAGLAPLKWRGICSVRRLSLELGGADVVERGMAPHGIVEAVDIAGNGLPGLGAGVEHSAPDELGFDRFKERLDHGVIEAVALARHRDCDAVATQLGLVVDGAVLAAAVGVVDQSFGRPTHDEGLAQGSECQIAV